MSKRRSGEHNGHSYRCWLEPLNGKYRAWYRGKLKVEIGDKNFVDRLHAGTELYDTPEEALDAAEARVKIVIDEVAEAAGI